MVKILRKIVSFQRFEAFGDFERFLALLTSQASQMLEIFVKIFGNLVIFQRFVLLFILQVKCWKILLKSWQILCGISQIVTSVCSLVSEMLEFGKILGNLVTSSKISKTCSFSSEILWNLSTFEELLVIYKALYMHSLASVKRNF